MSTTLELFGISNRKQYEGDYITLQHLKDAIAGALEIAVLIRRKANFLSHYPRDSMLVVTTTFLGWSPLINYLANCINFQHRLQTMNLPSE